MLTKLFMIVLSAIYVVHRLNVRYAGITTRNTRSTKNTKGTTAIILYTATYDALRLAYFSNYLF